MSTTRTPLVGHQPVVEYRRQVDRYFVTFPSIGVELVMGFIERLAAWEIAINAFHGTPFYTIIPSVPLGTPYPRPNMTYPKLDTEMVIPLELKN